MGKNKIVYIFLGIPILIVIDIFSRFLYEKSWFSSVKLSNEVDPIDIFSIIASSIVAIWLGLYITRKLSAQRFQKEYLISDIKKIEEEVSFIEGKMQESNIELQTIIELLNKFKLYIDRFSSTIRIFQVTSINSCELNYNYNRLYSTTTNTEGDLFIIDETVRIEINVICSSIIESTRQMIYIINNE